MKKVELTLKQMVEAVKVNGKEPWNVLGVGRKTWFRIMSKNELTMDKLRGMGNSVNASVNSVNASVNSVNASVNASVNSVNASVNASVNSVNASVNASVNSASSPVRTIRPVPQWQPNVANEPNTVGRGGVRYRYTDTEKYNEFKKEDAFRIMERAIKDEVTHKPIEREIKPEIPEELLQYDQIDVPYEVWTKYIDESKGEHWGTFVMRYGRFLEPKEHKPVDTSVEPRKVYPKGFLF